jgi:MFS family permease
LTTVPTRRGADLLGRRRILVAGTSLFALASLVGGLAGSEGMLVGAHLAQRGPPPHSVTQQP